MATVRVTLDEREVATYSRIYHGGYFNTETSTSDIGLFNLARDCVRDDNLVAPADLPRLHYEVLDLE